MPTEAAPMTVATLTVDEIAKASPLKLRALLGSKGELSDEQRTALTDTVLERYEKALVVCDHRSGDLYVLNEHVGRVAARAEGSNVRAVITSEFRQPKDSLWAVEDNQIQVPTQRAADGFKTIAERVRIGLKALLARQVPHINLLGQKGKGDTATAAVLAQTKISAV